MSYPLPHFYSLFLENLQKIKMTEKSGELGSFQKEKIAQNGALIGLFWKLSSFW